MFRLMLILITTVWDLMRQIGYIFTHLIVAAIALTNILSDFRHPLTRFTCFIIAFVCLLRMNLGLVSFPVILLCFAALEKYSPVMLNEKALFDFAALKKAEVLELERRKTLAQEQMGFWH